MKLKFTCLLIISHVLLYAQLNTGINTSSWGGVSNINWNPAFADGKYKVDVSLGTFNSGFYQNHGNVAGEKTFTNATFKDFFGLDMLDNKLWNITELKKINSDPKPRNVNQWSIIEGPGSFMFPIQSGKHAFALSYHFNSARSVRDADPIFARWSAGDRNIVAGNYKGAFNIAQAAWMDYGLSYSAVIVKTPRHLFKGGVTLKLLQCTQAAVLNTTNLDYDVFSDGTIAVNSSELKVTTTLGSAYSVAGDLGLVYEFRPKIARYEYEMDGIKNIVPKFKDIHTLAIGFSVIDIGKLSLNKDGNNGTYNYSTVNSMPGELNLFLTQQSADMVAIRGSANSQANKASIWLPTRFNAYIDVNIAKGFGINLNTSMSPYLKSKDKNQLVYGNYISLVPRLDYPMFGFYLPVTYNLNGTISVGASMRAGPVWFGVNDFYGMASNGGLKNANFFAGVKIPIYYAKPKDRDKDKVSNRYDFCVSKPGTWTAGGCPDRDMDSVRDEADACPDQFGPKQFAGCPDADGDNVIDDKDDCPGIAGDINTNGCPDKDQDGIPDKDDICPDEAGTLAMKGCGDKDGDGVANNVDKCPDMKGDKAHGGCPDRDGDGVFDNEDDDPDVEGPIENKGKPYGDSDDDGVPDNEDTCKLIFGKKEFHGCPTPPRPNLISEMINTYDITINFGVNQWELTAAHEKLLAVLAKKMNSEEQKYNNIIIVGHTDSLETSPGNEEALSIRRAKAATDYLFYTQGIPRSRLEPAGMGSEQPIGDNTKIAGRAKNRRLSIYIRIVSN